MALKFKYGSREQIPAEHVGFYTERDGAWLLDVDGAVEKSKLEEFRTTNVALMKERDELKQRFGVAHGEQDHRRQGHRPHSQRCAGVVRQPPGQGDRG